MASYIRYLIIVLLHLLKSNKCLILIDHHLPDLLDPDH